MSQIRVTITDERGQIETIESTNLKATSSAVNSKGKIKDKQVKENDDNSKSLAVASMVASQTFNYMTSNIGKWTGSTQNQVQINNAMQLVSLGAMAYISPVMAIATAGISVATTALDTAYEQTWDKYQTEYNKRRVGELKGRGR